MLVRITANVAPSRPDPRFDGIILTHSSRAEPVEREVEVEHVDRLLAEDAEGPAVDVVVDQLADLGDAQPPDVGDARGLEARVGDGDVGVEPGARRRDGVDGDLDVVAELVELR